MKKKYFFALLSFLVCLLPLNAQVSKTIEIPTPGTLSTLLTSDELNTVTDLTLTGQIDRRDFETMRADMPVLANIDIKDVTISANTGDDGTVYASNSIPSNAFCFNNQSLYGKESLQSIVFPTAITGIGEQAFTGCINLVTANLPNTLITIEEQAFFYCKKLTGITLPGTLINIGDWAFGDCTALTNVHFPATLTTIGDYAFDNCSGLTSIDLPATLTKIGDMVFSHCTGLTSINLPDNLTTIGNGMLMNCKGLTSITLPSALITIGSLAFYNCTGLTNISFPATLTNIGDDAFSGCNGLTSINLLNNLSTIESSAFSFCISLTSVTLPSSITTIGNWAFGGCIGLSEIKTFSTVPQTITDDVWENVDKETCKLIVPKDAVNAYKAAPVWSSFTNISEFLSDGLSSSTLTRAKAWTADGRVYVSSSEAINKVELISLSGSILSKEQAQKTIYQLNMENEKVAIVRVTYQDGSSESIKVAENKD